MSRTVVTLGLLAVAAYLMRPRPPGRLVRDRSTGECWRVTESGGRISSELATGCDASTPVEGSPSGTFGGLPGGADLDSGAAGAIGGLFL